MITIIMGKTASGKDTLQNELVKRGFIKIISTTTRAPREGEAEGVNYNYVDKGTFLDLLTSGEIFEYRRYDSSTGPTYFGARKIEADPYKNYVTVVDPGGAQEYLRAYGPLKCLVVYIEAPDDIRKLRAQNRGSFNENEWEIRFKDEEERFAESNISITDVTLQSTIPVSELADQVIDKISEYQYNRSITVF